MAVQRVLLPYNFDDYDHRAMEFVIRMFAGIAEVEVVLFNAYTPAPDIAGRVHEAAILERLKHTLGQFSRRIREQESALHQARDHLVAHGFTSDQVRCVYKPRRSDIATEIVDLASAEPFDLIVINHRPGKATRFFTGSVSSKVIDALKDTAVCVVT